MLTSPQKHFFFVQLPVFVTAIAAAIFSPASVFSLTNLGIIFLLYCLIFGFAIEVGFHRYFSHRAFELRFEWMKYLITYLGLFAMSHAPFSWILVHRQHHKYSDTKGDIHSPVNGGFWFSFIGWNNKVKDTDITIRKNELVRDKFQVWLHRNYLPFMVTNLVTLLALFPHFTAFTLFPASLLAYISVGLGAALSHTPGIGYKNFELGDNSNNLLLFGIWSFGLGYQNNHHKYPGAETVKVKWYEFDPGYYIVKLIKKGQ